MAKTIFITGASRGFGRIWAEAFLNRGDNVVVTSRNLASLQGLTEKYGTAVLPMELDITSRSACFAAMEKVKEHFGSIDVVINNAATSVMGMVEELDEQAIRKVMDANFFGTLWVTQAALPVMRAQGSGHIIQLSSALAVYTFPSIGMYSATKFAVEGFTEALYQEMKSFGVHVSIVEPNGFATEFGTTTIQSTPIPAHDNVRAELYANPAISGDDVYGDPRSTAEAILTLVDAPEPPLRMFLGKKALPLAQAAYQERLATWEAWNEVATAAHGG